MERLSGSPDQLRLPDLAVEQSVCRSPDEPPLPEPQQEESRPRAEADPLAISPPQPAASPPPKARPRPACPTLETKQVTRWALSPKFKELQASFKIPTGQRGHGYMVCIVSHEKLYSAIGRCSNTACVLR